MKADLLSTWVSSRLRDLNFVGDRRKEEAYGEVQL